MRASRLDGCDARSQEAGRHHERTERSSQKAGLSMPVFCLDIYPAIQCTSHVLNWTSVSHGKCPAWKHIDAH